MTCDRLITFAEESTIYPPLIPKLNSDSCKDVPTVRWYYTDTIKKIDRFTTIDTKEFRIDILDKDKYSLLQHCCYQKEFFESEEKFVYIGNITINETKRNLGTIKKLHRKQKKVYSEKGFYAILLDAFIGASSIWFRIGYDFVDNSHRVGIEKVLRDYLVDIKKFSITDAIKINLSNVKSEDIKEFRPYLEKNYTINDYIPMICMLKDEK